MPQAMQRACEGGSQDLVQVPKNFTGGLVVGDLDYFHVSY